MRTLPFVLLFSLACMGMPEPEPVPEPAAEPATPAKSMAERVADTYPAHARGVCRKYTDCGCNPYGTVDDCQKEFGDANSVFPSDVWSCVLARDCRGLCEENAGTCFELYALTHEGTKKKASPCPSGKTALEIYDRSGTLVRTDCN